MDYTINTTTEKLNSTGGMAQGQRIIKFGENGYLALDNRRII